MVGGDGQRGAEVRPARSRRTPACRGPSTPSSPGSGGSGESSAAVSPDGSRSCEPSPAPGSGGDSGAGGSEGGGSEAGVSGGGSGGEDVSGAADSAGCPPVSLGAKNREGEALTITTGAAAGTEITAAISNAQDYQVCIDSSGDDVAADTESACTATTGNTWHTTYYYDYDDSNGSASIESRAGIRAGLP